MVDELVSLNDFGSFSSLEQAEMLSTAARADRVLVLDHGRLVEDGSHNELVNQGGVYAQMYEAWVAATAAI